MFIQLGEAALIIVLCIGIGGVPLVGWIVRAATGKDLAQRGTGNVSVAAAFQLMGIERIGELRGKGERRKEKGKSGRSVFPFEELIPTDIQANGVA